MKSNRFYCLGRRLFAIGPAWVFIVGIGCFEHRLLALEPPLCDQEEEIKIAPSSKGGIYTGVLVNTVAHMEANEVNGLTHGKDLDEFTKLAGKKPAIVLSRGELPIPDGTIKFPKEHVKKAWKKGIVTRIDNMIPMSEAAYMAGGDKCDDEFAMEKFINGDFDKELIRYAQEVKRTGIPVMLGWGWEVNAGWPWSGGCNGGFETDGYGGPDPDGPERYRDAYRHVIDLFREQGVKNVTWVFHGTDGYKEEEEGNALHYYYPGDEYIDWLCISVYGEYGEMVRFMPFERAMENAYRKMASVSANKPMGICELGIVEDPRQPKKKFQWIDTALRQLAGGRWPRIKFFLWWQEYTSTDDPKSETGYHSTAFTAIDSTPASLKAYQEGIKQSAFLDKVEFQCRR